tara:strand:- start:5 stop:442 length:438 start_codon:yes stop_codon:yes gene_type:complete
MAKVIIYNQENGIMAISVPGKNSGLTIEELAVKYCPEGAKIIDRAKIDALDRNFRAAFVCDADMNPVIDMKKAKDVWREKIRKARKPKLEELDIQYMKAQEAGEDTSAIVAKKNKLRDFPAKSEIDAASNLTELKLVWDNDLGDK